MNTGGVDTFLIFILCPNTPCLGCFTPRDEYWRGVHPKNIHRVPLYPLSTGLCPSRRIFEGCTPYEHSSCAPIPPIKGSMPFAMNVREVYTLPISIVCPFTPHRGVHTPRNEYLRGVHPSNIHRLALYPVSRGRYPSQSIFGGVYTRSIFIACPCTPCRGVYTPCNECSRGIHPSNIHRLPLYPPSRGSYPSQ